MTVMAKLLIVEDYIQTIKKISKQFEKINEKFHSQNVFCFIPADESKLEIQTISHLDSQPDLNRIDFSEKKANVLTSLHDYLKSNADDVILILIDVLLISPNPNAPSLDQYQLNKEYSCSLYADLIKARNGKYQELGISGNNLYFVIYSRSDSILSVVAPTLESLYTDEDSRFYPRECFLPPNISWCKNLEEEIDTETKLRAAATPLALPDSYIQYFRKL